MTKLQNVGGYGILAIPTLPAIIVFFHAIRGTLGGALVSSAPTELRVPSHRFHGFTQKFLTVAFSHRIHRIHRTILL